MSKIYRLPVGHELVVTAGDKPASIKQVEDPTIGAVIHDLNSRTFGPYLVERSFKVSDGAAVVIAASDISTKFSGALTLSAGAPVDAVRASLVVNPTGDDNALTFTSKEYGAEGNRITVEYRDPVANDAELSVSVSGKTIVASLATGVAGAITSTAAGVKAAIDAFPASAALVSVAVYTADSGSADDGTGVVTAMAAASLANGAGTGIGVALAGGMCIDTTNAYVYRNSGTQAAPVWTKMGDAA